MNVRGFIAVDHTKARRAFNSILQRDVSLQVCRCALCTRCWCDLDAKVCIYGGPFTAYEREVAA